MAARRGSPDDHGGAGTTGGDADPWRLANRPGFLIRRLHQIHVSLFMEACAPFDITPLQYSILSALAEGGAADLTTLAISVALDRTTTTDIVKRLQARGLVTRAQSAQDRRSQVCRLEPAGIAMLVRMEAGARRAHKDTISSLEAEDQDRLIGLMRRIVAVHDDERSATPV